MQTNPKIIIIANAIALLGNLLMILASAARTKKQTLIINCAEVSVFTVTNILLLSPSGAIVNAMSIVRNILVYKEKMTQKIKAVYLSIVVTLSLIFNAVGFVGILPVISTILFTTGMTTKDEEKFKKLIIIIMLFWTVYDFAIKGYVNVAFDIGSIVAAFVSLLKIRKDNLKEIES